MRFAAVATIGAALAGAAFLGAAVSPGMSEPEFVRGVQCLAYQAVGQTDPAANELRARLAFEQHAQSDAAVARAEQEIRAIGQRAAQADAPASLRREREAACGGADARFASDAHRGPA
jgi:hypothetical protein